MGGKRPEQSHKDKLSTDYKTRTDDEHIHEQDKQHLHEERGKLVKRNHAAVERDLPETD